MPICRREIPSLEATQKISHRPVIVARSYPFGRTNPMSSQRGRSIMVWVRVHPDFVSQCRVRFYSTIDQTSEDIIHIEECHRGGNGIFFTYFVPSRTGNYVFRASFSLDGGESWTFDDVPDTHIHISHPVFNEIRMYTLLPTASDHIANWKVELERIKGLGFNTIHLLPVTFMDESESPYSAHDLFSIDPSYLDPNDPRDGNAQWEDFVERSKSLGIRLCIDLVLNHVGARSRIARTLPEWIQPDSSRPDGFKRAGCWTDYGWLSWEDLLLLNYNSPDQNVRTALWNYMSEYALYWANFAAYTGGMIRLDNLHSSNPDFIGALTRTLRSKYKGLPLLAEFFGDEQTVVQRSREWDLDLLLATPWDYKRVPELRSYLKNLHRLSAHIQYYVPVSSHDSGSPFQDYWSVDATFPRYATSALLSFGSTGISQGVEWGVEKKINFIGRKISQPRGHSDRLAGFIKRINEIHRAYSVFRQPQNCQFVDSEHLAIIAAIRRDPLRTQECYLVAANFDVGASHSLTVDLSPYFSDRDCIVSEELITRSPAVLCDGLSCTMVLGPCEVKVIRFRYEIKGLLN